MRDKPKYFCLAGHKLYGCGQKTSSMSAMEQMKIKVKKRFEGQSPS